MTPAQKIQFLQWKAQRMAGGGAAKSFGHVVDSEGNPLTAYHGTSDEIDKFQLGHPNRKDVGWLGHGIYFTNSPDMAMANAEMKAKRVGGTPKVMSVHLNLQNPYYATLGDKARLQKANSSEASQAFTNALKDKGHDGVIWKQNDYHEYVAFHPDQVKILPQDDVEKKAKGGEVNADKTQAFMDDYLASTSPHPFNDNARIHGENDAVSELSPWQKQIHLSDIMSLNPNGGGGTRALKEIKALSDKHGVPVSGIAKTYHKDKKFIGSTKRLLNWYEKHGFKNLGGDDDDGYDIKYTPSKQSKATGGVIHKDEGGVLSADDPERAANLSKFMEGADPVLKDEKGQPKRFYHATYAKEPITSFDRMWSTNVRRPSMDTVGTWFSDNPSKEGGAGMYASNEGASMYPMHLSAKKLKTYKYFHDFLADMHDAEGRNIRDQNPPGIGSTEGLREKLKAQGYDGLHFPMDDSFKIGEQIQQLRSKIKQMEEVFHSEARRRWDAGNEMPIKEQRVYQKKIDALIEKRKELEKKTSPYANSTEFGRQNVVVVFEPHQIKSPWNRGTFDPSEEDTHKVKGGAVRMNTGGPVSLDAMRLALLNVPKMADGGDFESDSLLPQGRAQRRMASNMMAGPKPLTIMKETGGQWLNGPFGNVEPTIGQYRQSGDATPEKQAVNNWVNTTLTKYMKRDFGTENDPVRLLHEQGITHYSNPDKLNEKGQRDHLSWITNIRKDRGMPETAISKSNLAKGWEAVSDPLIRSKTAKGLIKYHSNAVEMLSENPWMKKVDPQTKVFSFDNGFTDNTEFKHLTDELHNSLLENTNLPKSLQLRPESLNRMSVAQAVSHVHKINNWRKENMGNASREKAMTSAVHLHKDYPDSNYAWYEIKHPEMTADEKAELRDSRVESMEDASESLQAKYKTLEDALEYEGDVMGHCVGGYADEVASGKSRIFSLRNKKTGEPHVTVETYPKPISDLEQLPSSEKIPMQQAIREWRQRNPQVESLTDNHVREALKEAKIDLPEDIEQIKGKGNGKPVGKYIPFVQDFVKSGNWGDVGDLYHTDLINIDNTHLAAAIKKSGQIPSKYVTQSELTDLLRKYKLPKGYAAGGTAQGTTMPTLAQMKMALMKPNDISAIGAQEAPSMSPKAYVSPDKGELTLNGIPIGGVDMSGLQQGQQLMPPMPQPPQPQGGPQGGQPPQGALPQGPPQAPPQGPQGPQSNMLQMTPQGQMMGAMKPQGAASGGSIQYPTINPAVLRNQDDGASLQKVNWMSGGDVEGMAGGGAFKFRGMRLKPQQRAAMYAEREQDKPSTRVTVQAQGPGGVRGIVVPRHMMEGSLSYNPEDDTEKYVEGMDARNEARAKVYGSENRDPLTIGQIGRIHKETLDSHFQKPISEQIEEEKAALERLRAAKHINKDANTLDESEKLDTVRHEYDEEGRPHVGYASKGIAGHALYTSGTGENKRHHVLNVCPGQTSGCGGGVDENGIVDTSKGTCFAPNAESQYVNASVRRACHSQAKADPAMTRDWILAHTGSLRDKARLADKNGERVLFRPNVVDESDTSSRFVTRYLNRQREKEGLPSIIGNSYGKTNELHDPENGWYVTHSNVGPKVKDGRSIAENISRDKQRVRGTILAQEANGSDIKNEDDRPTPPKNSYLVTDVKRDSPLDKRMQGAFKYIKYWSAGKPVESLSSAEKDEGSSGHFGPDGKPTSPDKAHYGHITLDGRRYDYQKQHVLHPRLVSVGKNEDGSDHMIPTDSRFMDNAELDKQIPRAKQFKTKSGKRAGLILVTTPTTSTSNEGHETSFTHHVGSAHIDKALKNKGEWEIDSPIEQEATRDKLWAEPKTVNVSAIRKNYAAGGAVSDEFDEYMAFPERSRLAQQHLAHRKEDHFHKHTDHSNTYKMSPISKNLDVMRLEMIRKGK